MNTHIALKHEVTEACANMENLKDDNNLKYYISNLGPGALLTWGKHQANAEDKSRYICGINGIAITVAVIGIVQEVQLVTNKEITSDGLSVIYVKMGNVRSQDGYFASKYVNYFSEPRGAAPAELPIELWREMRRLGDDEVSGTLTRPRIS